MVLLYFLIKKYFTFYSKNSISDINLLGSYPFHIYVYYANRTLTILFHSIDILLPKQLSS